MKIAVAGKGGVGKTFIAANLAKLFAGQKQSEPPVGTAPPPFGTVALDRPPALGHPPTTATPPVGTIALDRPPTLDRPPATATPPVGTVALDRPPALGHPPSPTPPPSLVYAEHTIQVGQVYALDADPIGGLGAALGLTQAEIDGVKPIVDMREFIEPGKDDGDLYLSAPDVDNVGGRYSTLADGINFLRMAYIKQAGAECYCHEHGFLQALIKSMLLADNDILILDMSAGIEHLTRGAIKGADVLLIVSEATRACIEATKIIRTLGADLGVPRIYVVANKIRSEKEELLIRASFRRGELIGLVRMSEAVSDMAIGVGASRRQKTYKPSADIEELFNQLISISYLPYKKY